MNKSYSKIRHIQEANVLLEKRILNERILETTTTEDPNITQLVTKLKELPFYQDEKNLRVDGNKVYYTGNINGTTVLDRNGNLDKRRSQIGTLVNASDPNARFFEWSGTGWKRGEQQSKYYDQNPIDLTAALDKFSEKTPTEQQISNNLAANK